jgi:hypothetical protein
MPSKLPRPIVSEGHHHSPESPHTMDNIPKSRQQAVLGRGPIHSIVSFWIPEPRDSLANRFWHS